MNKEIVVYLHNGVLLSHKKEWNCVVLKKIDGIGHHPGSQPVPQRQVSHVCCHVQNLG
jgi:hypothetical protein